jgi:L-alanine-DL-glutamate epimerase-like enolase superfamily enzyme
MLDAIRAAPLMIPFKRAFKHASAERAATQTLWVEARSRDGTIGYGEGCPREYVTGEYLASAQTFVESQRDDLLANVHDVATLQDWAADRRGVIDANPAAWAAVELALLDVIGKSQATPVEALLGLPPLAGKFRYTAVLGDAPPEQFAAQLAHYRHAGFRDFKIKLAGDPGRDLAKVRALEAAGVPPQAVRADANNLWPDADAALRALDALEYPFYALEEPLHAGDFEGMQRIAQMRDTRIVLDESLVRADRLDELSAAPAQWLVNLRVSKMGGLARSLDLVRALRERAIGIIVGAHVGETSVLTRAALTVAHAARDLLHAQEGAFGTHLLAHDVADPPIMFGPGGVLDVDTLGLAPAPGLGLAVRQAAFQT